MAEMGTRTPTPYILCKESDRFFTSALERARWRTNLRKRALLCLAAKTKTPKSLKESGVLVGGDGGTRTPDPLHAKQVLYQLSYIPLGR
jgi:hypothetical protein